MAKKIKAADYTHSVWSGKKYDRPQTQDELTRESQAVVKRIAPKCDDDMMRRLFGSAYTK